MEWRHRKNAFAGQSKTKDLQDHGNRFENENTTYEGKEKLLFAADGNNSDHPPDRERSCVTHDNSRGMAIEPEKAQTGSHERRTDYGELSGVGIKRDLKIFRDPKISGGVGKQCIGKGDRDRAADGEAIQPIGEIDR